MTTYRNVGGDGLRIFYREEGSSEGWNPIQKILERAECSESRCAALCLRWTDGGDSQRSAGKGLDDAGIGATIRS